MLGAIVMSKDTKIDVNALNTSATNIGNIAQDTSPFDKLAAMDPTTGTFDAAKWLQDIVRDRRDGLVQHGRDLQKVFADMQAHLQSIATDYQNADTSNADGISKLNGQIDSEISTLQTQMQNDAPGLYGTASGSSSAPPNYNSGDNTSPGGAKQTVTFDPNGAGSTVTQSNGKNQHVDGGAPQYTSSPDYGNSPDTNSPVGNGSGSGSGTDSSTSGDNGNLPAPNY